MRQKIPDSGLPPEHVDQVLRLNTQLGLEPEEQAEARKLLHSVFGPAAEPIGKYCSQLAAARRENAQLQEKVRRIEHGPRLQGIVIGVENGHAHVQLGPTQRMLPRPADMELSVGQTVVTDADAQCILDAGRYLTGGQAFAFCEWTVDGYALIRAVRGGGDDEARQLALVSDGIDRASLTTGAHVLGWSIDNGNLVLVTRTIGPIRATLDEPPSFRAPAREEIVGLDAILDEIGLLFVTTKSEKLQTLLDRASPGLRGFLLHGPTGIGKSKVAEYFLGVVRAAGGKVLYRTASAYLDKYVGAGAARLRGDFEALDAAYEETGVRPLLVVDEIEAIALDRSHAASLHAGYLDVLDTFLSYLTRTHARVIGISNLADRVLDTAITRDGRLRILPFPATLPAEASTRLVAELLRGLPLEEDADGDASADALAQALSDFVYAPSGPLADLLQVQLADGRVLHFGAVDFATGAAFADGIVRPLLARHAERDLRAGRDEPTSISFDDLRDAAVGYFFRRTETITRDNVTRVFPGRWPEDQHATKVERTPLPAEWKPAV